VSNKRNPRIGSSLDDFLKAEANLEELQVQAVREVVAWQLEEAMKKKKRLSKATPAKMLHTSRTQANRVLDPASPTCARSRQRRPSPRGR
jgi:antitoxin HicB